MPSLPWTQPRRRRERCGMCWMGCKPGGWQSSNQLPPLLEDDQNFLQALSDFLQTLGRPLFRERQSGGLCLGFEVLARPGDGEALVIEQLLDAKHALDVALTIHPLARAALYRFQLRELGLPEAQHIGGQAAEAGHLANAEI